MKERRNYCISKTNLELLTKLSEQTNFSMSSIVDSALTEFFERPRDSLVLSGDDIRHVYKFPDKDSA